MYIVSACTLLRCRGALVAHLESIVAELIFPIRPSERPDDVLVVDFHLLELDLNLENLTAHLGVEALDFGLVDLVQHVVGAHEQVPDLVHQALEAPPGHLTGLGHGQGHLQRQVLHDGVGDGGGLPVAGRALHLLELAVELVHVVHLAAQGAIHQSGLGEATDLLISILNDGRSVAEIRLAAAQALGDLGTVRASEALRVASVAHPFLVVRQQSRDAYRNQGGRIAENEYDTIMRRAVSGELISPSVSDIHQDHLGTHIKDLEAHLARHAIAPWKRNDVLGFAGMVEHVGEHLQVLLGNKDTNEEAKLFTKRLQEVVQAAQAVVKEVDEKEGTEQSQMTEKERAELELKNAEFQLKARKLDLEEEAFVTLNASRLARQSNIERGQFSREIESARRLNQTDAQIAIQAKQQKSTNESNN